MKVLNIGMGLGSEEMTTQTHKWLPSEPTDDQQAFILFANSLKTETPSKRDARKLFIAIEREQIELSKKLKNSQPTNQERLSKKYCI